MAEDWISKWNERYSKEEYAYGKQPNVYLKEQISKLKLGKILFPADGEGRNGVYAATQGWKVSAFDLSIEGQKKALNLAQKNKVSIDYQIGELNTLNYKNEEFDAIAFIYAHFPAQIKSKYYIEIEKYLKKGGYIIFEAFSKNHLKYNQKNDKVGGPRDLETLFSIDEIKTYFVNYKVIELTESVITLNEGLYHNGEGSVIRFVGQKL